MSLSGAAIRCGRQVTLHPDRPAGVGRDPVGQPRLSRSVRGFGPDSLGWAGVGLGGIDQGVENQADHVVERGLSLFGGHLFVSLDLVADRGDR